VVSELITAYQLKMRRKKKQNKRYPREQTTFDPKIHIKTGTGYHMKPNAPVGNLSGSQLKHILK
jgi:hypothetical protein